MCNWKNFRGCEERKREEMDIESKNWYKMDLKLKG